MKRAYSKKLLAKLNLLPRILKRNLRSWKAKLVNSRRNWEKQRNRIIHAIMK